MDNRSIKSSPQINEIASALAKAQGTMKPAAFNRCNTHFRQKYADFTSCMEACRGPLSENGLAVTQLPSTNNEGKFILNTLLLHTSGQWMSCEFPLVCKNPDNIQALGSVLSYAKRYSLCGMLGIVADQDVDDDGEAALGRDDKQKPIDVPVAKLKENQIVILKQLEVKLNAECTSKIYEWFQRAYNINRIEDLPQESFTKVLGAYENAIKFLESEKVEVMNA